VPIVTEKKPARQALEYNGRMKITPLRTGIFKEGENLVAFIRKNVKKLPERSVLVVTSKIVALSERRTAIAKNEKEKEQWIKKESQWAMRTKYVWLTIRDGLVMASAGIDESNANGKLILLPKDSFKAAANLQKQLRKIYKVRELGLLITDSRIFPLRNGVVGVALGYAGFKGIKDYRGTPDLFGRKFHFSKTDVADSLATAAVLPMGEGRERQPLAIITGAPIEFTDRVNRKELEIDIKEDLYQPLFAKIKTIKTKRVK
jgi:F420-0:gamma-glutamyl ligase